MDELTICPSCHIQVRSTDYFCFNCGKNLHPKPVDVSLGNIILYFIGSIMLPPLGLIWGIRYLRQGNKTTKIYGIFLILITLIELAILTKYTIDLTNTINDKVNSQLQNIQGF